MASLRPRPLPSAALAHVHALHFACGVVQPAQRDAARRRVPVAREQQDAPGRCVRPGQRLELLAEVLVTQRLGDQARVFAEQDADILEVPH
ncbi:MAG: hypothetical protein WDO13_20750 [Verrucomicrobiota bacterium]